MDNGFINMASAATRLPVSRYRKLFALPLITAVLLFAASGSAVAQEQMLFPAIDNAQALIVQKIRNETVRVDIATWYLNDGEIALAIVNKHKSGVPVRVIGDRGAIFEADPNTRAWFEYLANNGVPIRLRYHPTWFPYIMHWKCGIFVGQGTVEFGSANWTTYELAPWSTTNFKDETAMFTNDGQLLGAFMTKFEDMWTDTENFLDWPEAYRTETGQTWTAPMTVLRTRLAAVSPTNVPGMVWAQGTELTTAMLYEIERETQAIDFVAYRLTIPALTDALIRKHQAGVPVRVFVEQTQYRNQLYPEYELTGANIDRLWAAGIPIKQRRHEGLMHMKSLITSNIALNASSNFTKNWERDHNYFIPAATKPALHLAMKSRFNTMWNDATNYEPFRPQRPAPASNIAPAYSGFDVPATVKLEWKRALWATSFDVYLGTNSGNLPLVGRVNAQVDENPPPTYSFTPPQPLLPSTTYYWRVVSRTPATDLDPTMTATADFWAFTTAASGTTGGTGSGPFGTSPIALPGTIQAENFDNGGRNIAYFDTSTGNTGGVYRSTDVDVENTTDAGGGHNVGWVAPSEWLKYSVNVAAAGAYTLEFRVASADPGGTFHIEANGVNLTGPVQIPATGGWQSWTTVTKTGVNLTAGPQVWTLVFDSAGATGAVGNLNFIRVATPSSGGGATPAPTPAPFNGTAAPLPGTVQAENFDNGGQGVAYQDLSAGNAGTQYRSTDVDVETSFDTGGGYNVGWATAGEWLTYTVNVATAGTYDIEVRVASSGAGGTFHIEAGGVDKTGAMTVPNTGGWQVWTTVRRAGVSLAAGQQVLRLVLDTNGAPGAVGNFNYITVLTAGAAAPPPAPPPPAAAEIVIHGPDVTSANLHGNWARVNDATAAGGVKIASVDRSGPTVSTPSASPVDYFEATFNAQAGVRYRLWMRMSATSNNKYNDSVWVQFTGSSDAGGNGRYRIGTAQALNVNLATCADCPPSGWGWQNRAYWESDTGDVWFDATGPQTIRVQIREDGTAIDQIVLSPQRYLTAAPGPPTLDGTIVPKP